MFSSWADMKLTLDQTLEALRQSLLIIFAAVSRLHLPQSANAEAIRAAGNDIVQCCCHM
jgi:hypothetical protein